MFPIVERSSVRRFGAVLVAVLCIGATTMFSKPADARVWVGVSFGAPGWGYYAPAYYGTYYPYYRPYYWHARHWWWHRHWCYWHPYRCGYYW